MAKANVPTERISISCFTVVALPVPDIAVAVSVYLPAFLKDILPPVMVSVPFMSLEAFALTGAEPFRESVHSTLTTLTEDVVTAICVLTLAAAGKPKSKADAVVVGLGVEDALGADGGLGVLDALGLVVGVLAGRVGVPASGGFSVGEGVVSSVGVGDGSSGIPASVGVGVGVKVGVAVGVAVGCMVAVGSGAGGALGLLSETMTNTIMTSSTSPAAPASIIFVFRSIVIFLQ